jgi:hypothetical protein
MRGGSEPGRKGMRGRRAEDKLHGVQWRRVAGNWEKRQKIDVERV